MKYDFNINKANIPCHLDIEEDIKIQKNGVFTFTIRTNQSIIMDYVCYSNATAGDYHSIIGATEPKREVPRHSRSDHGEDALRGGNGNGHLKEWGNATGVD